MLHCEITHAPFRSRRICSAATRVIVQDSVHDAFVDGLAQRAKKLRLGNPLEDGVSMGPLISEKQMERVLGYIESGRREGAEAVCGGERAATRVAAVHPLDVGFEQRLHLGTGIILVRADHSIPPGPAFPLLVAQVFGHQLIL